MADRALLFPDTNTLSTRNGGLHPPLEILLNWPIPNDVDPEQRGWGAPIALIVLLCITILVFVARMWARLKIAKNAGMDDILMGIALLPLLGLTISVILGESFAHQPRCLLTA